MNRTVRRKLIFFSALAAALVLAAVFSRQLCPYDPSCQNYDAVLEAPSRAHPFGTDQFGRDMLSRVLAGAATNIFSALVLVGIISVAGTAIGVICGYSGKAVDGILMRISDICLAFPGLVFALAIAAVLNGGIGNAVLALAVVSWPKYARIARSQTLSVKSSDYIASARLAGSRPLQIIFRHILPNSIGPIITRAMIAIPGAIFTESFLAYIGLGIRAPESSIGVLLSQGQKIMQQYPNQVFFPAVVISLLMIAFNMLSNGLRDAFDPTQRGA